jgi:hypothetical protein
MNTDQINELLTEAALEDIELGLLPYLQGSIDQPLPSK